MAIHSSGRVNDGSLDRGGERRYSLGVLREPYCREMPPAEFPDDDVAALRESVADLYRMVPSLDVVFPIFFVFSHNGGRVRGRVRSGVRHFLDGVSASISLQWNGLITLAVDSCDLAELLEISKGNKKMRDSDGIS